MILWSRRLEECFTQKLWLVAPAPKICYSLVVNKTGLLCRVLELWTRRARNNLTAQARSPLFPGLHRLMAAVNKWYRLPKARSLFLFSSLLFFLGSFIGSLVLLFDVCAPRWLGYTLVFVNGYFTWASIMALSSKGIVSWDETGISGPCRFFPLPFARNSNIVKWHDLATCNVNVGAGVVGVSAHDKRAVVWATCHRNHAGLREIIRQRCPNVNFRPS